MIDDLKDLEKLLKLCRKQGVTEIKLGAVELKLGDLPVSHSAGAAQSIQTDPANPYANFPDGELTPEQLMYYSAGGLPENDPYLKGEAN